MGTGWMEAFLQVESPPDCRRCKNGRGRVVVGGGIFCSLLRNEMDDQLNSEALVSISD